jgi:hypothetical protein
MEPNQTEQPNQAHIRSFVHRRGHITAGQRQALDAEPGILISHDMRRVLELFVVLQPHCRAKIGGQ